MAGQKTRVSFVDQAELFFEMWDELSCQGLSPRAVVHRIGEFVMAGRERTVQEDVNHLGALAFAHRFDELSSLSPRGGVVPAETVDVVDARIGLLRVFAVTRRQNDSGAHSDRAPT